MNEETPAKNVTHHLDERRHVPWESRVIDMPHLPINSRLRRARHASINAYYGGIGSLNCGNLRWLKRRTSAQLPAGVTIVLASTIRGVDIHFGWSDME